MTLAGKKVVGVNMTLAGISGDCCFDSKQEARTVAMFLLLLT